MFALDFGLLSPQEDDASVGFVGFDCRRCRLPSGDRLLMFNTRQLSWISNICRGAFFWQQVRRFGGNWKSAVEPSASFFSVVSDAVFLDERNKIRGRVTCEGGFAKIGMAGKIVFRRGVKIGEIATAAAGDEDFFAETFGMFLGIGDRPAAFFRLQWRNIRPAAPPPMTMTSRFIPRPQCRVGSHRSLGVLFRPVP